MLFRSLWPNPDITTLPLGTRLVTAVYLPDATFAGPRTYQSIANPSDLSDAIRAAFIHDVKPLTPTLQTVSPAVGRAGTELQVSLAGSNFISGATTLTFSGTGLTASAVNVTSATALTASVTINAGAARGARQLTVTTDGGTSEALSFMVPDDTALKLTPCGPEQIGRAHV